MVLLSYGLWRDRFGADPALVGRSIVLDRQPHTVVGVMPRGFDYPDRRALWTPLEFDASFRDPANRGAFQLGVIAPETHEP